MTSLETIPEHEEVDSFPSDKAFNYEQGAFSDNGIIFSDFAALSGPGSSPQPASLRAFSWSRLAESTRAALIASLTICCILVSLAPKSSIGLALLFIPTTITFRRWFRSTDEDDFDDMMRCYVKGILPAGIVILILQIALTAALALGIVSHEVRNLLISSMLRGRIESTDLVQEFQLFDWYTLLFMASLIFTTVFIRICAVYFLSRAILEENENYFQLNSTAWGTATAGLSLASLNVLQFMVSRLLLSRNHESLNQLVLDIGIRCLIWVPIGALIGYVIGLKIAQRQFYRLKRSSVGIIFLPFILLFILESLSTLGVFYFKDHLLTSASVASTGLVTAFALYFYSLKLSRDSIHYDKMTMLLINEC